MQSEQIYLKLVFNFLTPVESAESNSIMSVFCRDFFYIEFSETVLLTREKPAQLKYNLTFQLVFKQIQISKSNFEIFLSFCQMTGKVKLCFESNFVIC